jgi:hypothetical protein
MDGMQKEALSLCCSQIVNHYLTEINQQIHAVLSIKTSKFVRNIVHRLFVIEIDELLHLVDHLFGPNVVEGLLLLSLNISGNG